MMRVEVNPELLRWACERTGHGVAAYIDRIPQLDAWMRGATRPTLKQLERLANTTRTPIGYFFLPEPPEERIPIPDFRTGLDAHHRRPSPDLLETIYICQQRQEWYREFARISGETTLPFVGSVSIGDEVVTTASHIRNTLGFDLDLRTKLPTWTDALRGFIEQADNFGILVMCSGVVLNNNRRRLDPFEFRGFAIADDLAPLVFINGADTKASQMFTLAHELAHIWLGQSAVSNAEASAIPNHEIENWCNRVAAELLVPLDSLRNEFQDHALLQSEIARLARRFKVSSLVVLRRIYDAGGLTAERFRGEYQTELERILALPRESGGNFYLTQAARVSKRFARALVVSTLEGQTLYRDALRMLGFSKLSTFEKLGRSLGII
jgi:Zn-dependent peptidase ImmA (M78 family)/transcriptional regulator with XRE-family HTH domain